MTSTPSVTNLLRSWWHGARRGVRMARPAQLGVNGLPHGVGHLPVGTPAALLVRGEACWRDWSSALVADLLAAGPVLVLAAQTQDIDLLLQSPTLREAHEQGRLRAWLLPPQAQQRLQRDGLAAFARELERAGLSRDASLCLLDAGALLAGATVVQQRRLRGQLGRWSATRQRPLVLMFALHRTPAGTGSDIGAAVRVQGACFSHVAELGLMSERPVLTLYRWDGDQGAVFDARYDLRRSEAAPGVAARLHYAGSFSLGAVPMLADAPDQFTVYATQGAVERQRGVPATWHIAASLAALEEAVHDASGATVVLDAGAPEQFEDVAALVHRLRQARPRGLKIIVRETTSKLRSHSEQALMRLGATAVVYREVGFSRLLQLIEDSRQLVHARAVDSDYEQALAEFMPARVRGYLPAAQFVQCVGEMLRRTEDAGLVHSLVRLQLLPAAAHLDALHACRTQRDGDLVTADAQGLYVFLFACRETDLDLALAHLFALPLGQIFSSQMADSTPDGMAAMLERLEAAAPGLPDYTPLLAPSTPLPRRAEPHATEPVQGPASLATLSDMSATQSSQEVRMHSRPIGRRGHPSSEVAA